MTVISKTRTYRCWQDMKQRCLNSKSQAYKDYGARGITVCEQWKNSFDIFLLDMGEVPDGMSLDRKNNELGYSPQNCRWATQKQQNRNHRGCVFITYQGQTMTIVEWSELTGIDKRTIWARHKKGLPVEQIFNCNKFFQHTAKSNSKSGLIGASPHGKKWKSQVKINGVIKYLGLFETAEEASVAYINERTKLRERNT